MSSEVKRETLKLRPPVEPGTSGWIANFWAEGKWYRAEIPHNGFATDPTSTCTGIISVKFQQGERGIKMSPCQGCKTPVEVNLTALQIGFNIGGSST